MDIFGGIFNAIAAWLASLGQLLFGVKRLAASYDKDGKELGTTRTGQPVAFVVYGSVDAATASLAEIQIYLKGFDRPVDTVKYEYIFVTFTETLTDMAPGRAAGRDELIKQIKALDVGQKFVLCGGSEGAAVCSDVYDELRTGSLQDRRGSFLGGFMCGNPRRQLGAGFPNGPTTPGTSGAAEVRLSNTEPSWWEMALLDDPVTCVDDTNLGKWIRRLYAEVHKVGGTSIPAILALVGSDPDGLSAINLFSDLTKTGHVHYHDRFPFSDGRSYMQVGLDYVNSL